MIGKLSWRGVVVASCVAFTAFAGTVRADEIVLVTGEHWVKSSDEVKNAYLIGVANTLQVEAAYEGSAPPPDAQSLVPRMGKGLKGQTLDSVRETLNRWYAAHPDRLRRPVLETIWFEVVVSGLAKAG